MSQTEKESLKWQNTYQESAENLKTLKMENTKWHQLYKQLADNLQKAERDSFKWLSMFLQSRDNQHKTGEDNEKLNKIQLSAQVKESNKWHKIRQVRLDTPHTSADQTSKTQASLHLYTDQTAKSRHRLAYIYIQIKQVRLDTG